ncbi:serine threonine- phosphatase 6 regulatory ankyrin repeat subunit c [Fusarium longipes]|uniref:Serine threonine-phosphatase 6 regulatory ankyrin repeat subunit c n=1 Tax=Fusarium longipes TaxID=694270 RepID=A0A395RJM4_9HYPO|nr:serine threonine- phosphatase 6 regulatory ankyrin repeat subunit c [Fusarium longipes]
MSNKQSSHPASPKDSDVVVIGKDDIGDCSLEYVLPEPEDTIAKDGPLRIKGVPGSGKSVAAANMIRKLYKERVPVLYFFFRHIDNSNHRPINLLRDWRDQILHILRLEAQLQPPRDSIRNENETRVVRSTESLLIWQTLAAVEELPWYSW